MRSDKSSLFRSGLAFMAAFVAPLIFALFLTSSCRDKNSIDKIETDSEKAHSRFSQLQFERDLDGCWALIDSCEKAGVWPPEVVHQLRSNVCYSRGDGVGYEEELKKGIEESKKSITNYSYFIANYTYLASCYRDKGDYDLAMKTAGEAIDYLDSWKESGIAAEVDPTMGLLLDLTIGQTQAQMGNLDGARTTFEELWKDEQEMMDRLTLSDYNYFFTDLSAGIVSAFFYAESYTDVLKWLERYDQVFSRCSALMDQEGIDYYYPDRMCYEIVSLANTGQKQRAEALYNQLLDSPLSKNPKLKPIHVRVLRTLGRYPEAAIYYEQYLEDLKKQGIIIDTPLDSEEWRSGWLIDTRVNSRKKKQSTQ